MKSELIKTDETLDCLAWLPRGLKKIVLKAARGPNLEVIAGMSPDQINTRLGLPGNDDTGIDVQKAALESSTSMIYWWSMLSKIQGLNVPKTKIIQINRDELTNATVFAGEKEFVSEFEQKNADKAWSDFTEKWLEKIKSAWIEVAGGLDKPVFMRTDYFSSKHDWNETCFIPNYEDDLFHAHLFRLVENSECTGMLGLKIMGLVFREYLNLDTKFSFFHGEMPVGAERRYFIKNGEVSCHHVYWINDVFEEDCKSWNRLIEESEMVGISNPNLKPKTYPKDILQELNNETPEEIELLTGHANAVAKEFSGYWSVDFARAKDGSWFLIDMARGEQSWHDEHCINTKTLKMG